MKNDWGPSQAKQKLLTGGVDARNASRRPPACKPFLHFIAWLGSTPDILTLTGEYAKANDFEARLRTLNGFAKD